MILDSPVPDVLKTKNSLIMAFIGTVVLLSGCATVLGSDIEEVSLDSVDSEDVRTTMVVVSEDGPNPGEIEVEEGEVVEFYVQSDMEMDSFLLGEVYSRNDIGGLDPDNFALKFNRGGIYSISTE